VLTGGGFITLRGGGFNADGGTPGFRLRNRINVSP
jgi:hypothetical protein